MPQESWQMDNPSQSAAESGLSARLAEGIASGIAVSVTFRHPREIPDLAYFFSRPAVDPDRVSLGLAELMMNAVEHGILGIDSEEKQALLKEDRLHGEINRRLGQPQFRNVVATLSLHAPDGELLYTVSDPGPGFDFEKILKHTPHSPEDLVGRGIAIAARVGFSRLEYLGNGNVVRAHAAKKPA